eukprot:gene4135-2977_t
MPRVKAPKSKRMSSKQRHKIDRKKREHKRDLRKAAKALKEKGLGPQRSKKARSTAKLALQISNTHPDKEIILNSVLKARENARVEKYERRKRSREDDGENDVEARTTLPAQTSTGYRQLLYIPARDSNNFKAQFLRSLNELVFPINPPEGIAELPSVAYVITLDSRFAVQSLPWTLLDAIVEQGKLYKGGRKVLLLFTFTKVDLVSISALITQVSLVGRALYDKYEGSLGENIIATITPLSIHHDKTTRHLLRIINQFGLSDGCRCEKMESNVSKAVCTFVVGLPNTGRRSLCRVLTCDANESAASSVPLRAAQLQIKKVDENVEIKFAIPNARSIVFLTFPEDAGVREELKNVTGGDIMFRSHLFIEKLPQPEVVGCALFDAVLDKTALAQAFCQAEVTIRQEGENDMVNAAEKFMRDLGRTVRQEKGFHVSPLFVSTSGTMSQQNSSHLTANVNFTSGQKRSQETLLDATYSNATPSKLIRVSSVMTTRKGMNTKTVERVDGRNVLRLGARTLVRELCQARHVPWAVMRAPGKQAVTPEEIDQASQLFNLDLVNGKRLGSLSAHEETGTTHLSKLIQSVHAVIRDIAIFLPNGVVEMDPDSIVPPQYELEDSEEQEQEQSSDSDDDDDDEKEETD